MIFKYRFAYSVKNRNVCLSCREDGSCVRGISKGWTVILGFPGSSSGKKNLPADAVDVGSNPGGGNGNLRQYSCLENPMDRGTWPYYSLWSHKELDMAEVTKHAWTMILERKG